MNKFLEVVAARRREEEMARHPLAIPELREYRLALHNRKKVSVEQHFERAKQAAIARDEKRFAYNYKCVTPALKMELLSWVRTSGLSFK